ncbi:MAG TPA: two-component regulator propeller domain-containing protein [Rhodanobacteraceae bacterium]|nr:two-component regulator propeller domain-containing protein [Rhodanobacteraceae bacterium]
MFPLRSISLVLLAAVELLAVDARAGDDPEWRRITPGTTGIPGELVDLSAFDDDGNLWVFARFPFFQEWGLAMLPASSIPYLELPGGGFDTCCWTVWSNRTNPISSQFVHSMRIAHDGVIWIASDAGLTRFDRNALPPANAWTTYDQSNAPFVVSGVRSVDLAGDGTVWLTNTNVTQSNGAVFHFDPVANTWTPYEVGAEIDWGDDQNFHNVGYVAVGPDGHVWATHQVLSGLAEFDGSSWMLHTQCSAQLDGVLPDPNGNIWIASAQQGLWRWDGTTCANWPTLGGDMTILAMSFDEPSNTLYAANFVGGIFYTSNDGGTFDTFVDGDGIIPIGIHPRSNGDVWVAYNQQAAGGSQGGLVHYDSAASRIEAFNAINSGLQSYFIDRTFADSTGSLWFISADNGVSRYDGTHWRTFGRNNIGSEPWPFVGSDPVFSAYEDANGDIWIGGNGVGRWNASTGTFTGFWDYHDASFGVASIQAIGSDVDGNIWIGTDGQGIFELQGDVWVAHTFGALFATSNYVNAIALDSAGLMWVGTDSGLHTFDGQTWTEVDGLPVQPFGLRDVEFGTDGDVWVGSDNGALRYDGTTWTVYTHAAGDLAADHVFDISIRPDDGLVAIASNTFDGGNFGGVSLFDGTTWTTYTTANSPLSHFQVESVEFDRNGNLWVGPMSTGVEEILIGTPPNDVVFQNGFEVI